MRCGQGLLGRRVPCQIWVVNPSATDDFIFNAIRRNYLIRDLFGYQSPLKHEYYFFGRKKLVESVLDLHKSGQNSGLFGLRKSGKTSTIYAIQRRARTAACRTLVIDCQDPAVHAKQFGPLFEYILLEIRRELNLKQVSVSLGDKPDRISQNFQRMMNESLNTAGTDVLLILDEIENISPKTAASPHWRGYEDALFFWQTIRSFFQNAQKHKLTFCFVGTNPHPFEMPKIHDVANPVYLFAPKTFIPMLTMEETREMITRLGYFMGLDFSPNVVSHIHQRFGGHPFFIRQLCSQVHKKTPTSRPRSVSINACSEAERDAVADLQGYMRDILGNLKYFYSDEYAMLEYLVKGDFATFKEMAQYAAEYVEHLLGYGLVIRRGDDYEFGFDAVAEAVKRGVTDPVRLSREDKWSLVGGRRNALEQEMRSAIYRWAARLSPEGWSTASDACLTKARRDQLGPLTPREAFSETAAL